MFVSFTGNTIYESGLTPFQKKSSFDKPEAPDFTRDFEARSSSPMGIPKFDLTFTTIDNKKRPQKTVFGYMQIRIAMIE